MVDIKERLRQVSRPTERVATAREDSGSELPSLDSVYKGLGVEHEGVFGKLVDASAVIDEEARFHRDVERFFAYGQRLSEHYAANPIRIWRL